jgi:hypothetical protein
MVREQGTIPLSLIADELRRLVLEAINEGSGNPETFHALYGHVERGLHTNDVIHGLEWEWTFQRAPVFNKDFWQWKYYLDTESVGGDPILIIIAVDTLQREFEVITRWRQ